MSCALRIFSYWVLFNVDDMRPMFTGSSTCALDQSCSKACLCELQQVQQVQGVDAQEALRACQQDAAASGIEGWCYIDPAIGIGSAELVSGCPADQQRRIRFLGRGPTAGSRVLALCPDALP